MPRDAVVVLEIERHQGGAPAELADLVVEFLEPADRAGDRDHMRTDARQRERGRVADAARCAGDERDAVGEERWHGKRSFVMPGPVPGIHVFRKVPF